MQSDRAYWILIISSLLSFGVFVFYVLVPFQIISYDLGMNLISETFGIVFTIVFLTWIIKSRENKQWKIVENKVMERISIHLHDVFITIFCYFIEPIPKLPVDIAKEIENLQQRAEEKNGEQRSRIADGIIVKYLAGEQTINIGDCGKAILNDPKYYETLLMVRDFEEEKQFFEHIISEYYKFLSPILIRSIMEIEDCLDEVVTVFRTYLEWVIFHPDDIDDFQVQHESKFKEMIQLIKSTSETRVKAAIGKFIKELHQLNEKGLGFSHMN